MEFDKKTILAFILIGLVFIFVQSPLYKKAFFPKAYKQKQETKVAPRDTTDSINKENVQKIEKKERETKTKQAKQKQTPVFKGNNVEVEEKVITIDTKNYKATFSNKGASLIGLRLKNYMGPNDMPVQIIPADSYGTLGIEFISDTGDTLSTNQWMFSTEAKQTINLSDNKKTIKFFYPFETQKTIEKQFTFYDGRYDFDLKVVFRNMGDVVSEKIYFITAPTGLSSTEKRIKDDMYYAKAVVSAGGEVEKGYKTNGKKYIETGDIDWVAVRTKYFTLAIIPENKKGLNAIIKGDEIPIPNEQEKWKKYKAKLGMPFLDDNLQENEFKIYTGPLDYDILSSYNYKLEKMMDFGAKIIKPFSKGILWTFKKIHTVVPNYGVVLIIFAFLIKILVYPLTHKSYESMKKMQALQPKLTELKEKYQKDPQRLNKETMKLYKTAGVNPIGGCLPMLLQMPLLWGLFIVFRSTIELRGEGFALWINDLSTPDTIATLPFSLPLYGDSINILPLFMGATMLLQQKMSITDPKQKAMVYLMPIFLTLLFNSFPSGLNLYYALFNLLSIAQQKWLVGGSKKSN